MSVVAAPGNIIMYVKVNERNKQIVDEYRVDTTQFPHPADEAKRRAECNYDNDEALYMRVGKQP